MKKLFKFVSVCAVALFITSCSKPYYQMLTVKPTDDSPLKEGSNGLFYEDDSVKIEFDLMYNSDSIAYTVFNKSDKVLWFNKKTSLSVENLQSEDIWRGKNDCDEIYDYYIVIAPKTYGHFSSLNIMQDTPLRDARIKIKPKRKRTESVSYTFDTTPWVLGKYISYRFGNGPEHGVGLYFYVSKLTNYHRKDYNFVNSHKYPTNAHSHGTDGKVVKSKKSKKNKTQPAPHNTMYLRYFPTKLPKYLPIFYIR